jgi:hypothetical protein
MKTRLFRRWNWEFDFGVDELAGGAPVPLTYAVAFYDQHDRLYRVELRSREELDGAGGKVSIMYEYFCGRDGRVLQKRSIDEHGDVQLIVDFEYSDTDVTEIAWWPASNICKSIRRRITG